MRQSIRGDDAEALTRRCLGGDDVILLPGALAVVVEDSGGARRRHMQGGNACKGHGFHGNRTVHGTDPSPSVMYRRNRSPCLLMCPETYEAARVGDEIHHGHAPGPEGIAEPERIWAIRGIANP